MPLYDYNVNRDEFEEKKPRIGLCFPCCCCVHGDKEQHEEPCNHCDHNAAAEPEGE